MSAITHNLSPEVYAYYQRISLRETDILRKLRAETHKLHNSVMQISPEQGQFMSLLVQLLGAKKTLDIGTYTGYSALAVALALPKDGRVIACDVNQEWTDIAQAFWKMAGVEQKIDLYLRPAIQTLRELIGKGESGTFDFIFIDADKKTYCEYYEKSLALIRIGGMIAIDNVLWGGKVADPDIHDEDTTTIRELNQKLLNDERITLSVLPIGDGLALARKR